MDRQVEIVSLCRDLNSEKGPERRKAAVKLNNCLNQSSVKKVLDKNFEIKQQEGKKSRAFTWENVFRAVCIYVQLETAELEKANENVSKSTKTQRETRKKDISGLVKAVVRAADKGSPKLKGTLLFEHIKGVLINSVSCDFYGQDYCSLLLKNVLTVKSYVVELNSKELHEMVFLFCKLFNSADVTVDCLVLARIIHSLVHHLTVQCDVRPKKILSFFVDFFLKSKQQKSGLIVQHLVSALTILVRDIAPTSRGQVCGLGEEILVHMLHLWHNIATDELKECLLEFMQIQMWCHHPRGDRQGVGGAYARDWDKWMSHLRKLYDLMYTEIQQLVMKTRVKDMVLKPAFVSLAVDLCQQLFIDGSHAIEVTQLSMMDNDSAQPGPGPKRRRRETGWEAIRAFISDAGQSMRMIPWLQLVKGFIDKYPDKFPAQEVLPFLTCLAQVVGACKQTDLMAHLLTCATAFAAHWDLISLPMSEGEREQCKPAWNTLWMATLRFVSLHHKEGQGYTLLTAMMSSSLVTPRRDIWSLFVPSVTQPVTESIQFLWQQLTSADIPEKFVPSLIVPVSDVSGGTKFPLRMQLINWLLPALEDVGESSRSHKLDPDWTARTLMTLTLNDPTSSKTACELQQSHRSSLEEQYLEICLELPLSCVMKHGASKTVLEKGSVHVPVLLLAVETVIQRDVQYLCSRSDEQVSTVQETLTYCQMVANFLRHLLTNKIITKETVLDSNMYTCMSKLMKKISGSMSDLVKKDGVASVASLVESLKSLFNWSHLSLEVGGVMSSLCRAVSPLQLTDLLLDIAMDKLSKKDVNQSQSELGVGLNESRTIHERSRSRIMDFDDDEFDLDLEKEVSSHSNNNMEIDDLDFEERPESQESEENLHSMEICQNLLTTTLSESQTLRLMAVSTLCEWCRQGAKLSWKQKPEVDLKILKSKVVHLLSNDAFDIKKAFDLQMMVLIVTSLTEPHETLTTKELLTFATAVRTCVSGHRKDQEICAASINLLSRLVPHIGCQEAASSGSLRETQSIILHLADAFWKLESYSSPVRRQLTVLMERLMENDPQCIWSRFKSENDDVSPDSQDASGPSPADRFINSISDDCLLVRMKVSSAIYRLFLWNMDSYQEPLDRSTQESMFALLFKELKELVDLTVEANMSAERREDFCTAVDSTLLTSLGSVICHSEACEKISLFSLLQFVKEKSLNVGKVCKLLSKVSSMLGHDSLEQYVASHLPYLVHKWLAAEYPVERFPFQILNCTSLKQFYGEYTNVLIPELVACKSLQDIQHIGAKLGQPLGDLLRAHIPHAMTHILPAFASRKQSTKATAAYDLLVQELTKPVLEGEIVSNLDEIVVNLLLCLHETEHDVGAIRDTNPEPNPPFYSGVTVSATLDYLTKSCGADSSIVEILSKTSDSLQKILLKLSSALFTSRRMSYKRSLLFKYRLFTRLLLKHFHTQLGGSWAFVLRDVITRLVYLLTDTCDRPIGKDIDSCYRESIACVALELLGEVCHTAIDTCAKEFMKYVGFMTSNLIPVAECGGDIGQKALAILKLLIVERRGDLVSAVVALDNFPDRPAFEECRKRHQKLKYAAGRFNLKQEVEHFLSASSDHVVGSKLRLEGLHFLFGQLKENSDQLQTLKTDDTLLRLVCSLVELSKCKNQSVVEATSRCLGVLGPVDMSTICFPHPPRPRTLDVALTCFQDMPAMLKYCHIFHKLNDYLTDKSIELVQCTSDVLKTLLSVKSGAVFSATYKKKLEDQEYLFNYLHPFRASKKRALNVTMPSANWERFQSTVDQESLWNPPHSNHGNWLVTLTSTLLESGAVRDEILVLIGSVCKIKTELCEMVLPYIVHDILETGSADHREVLSRRIGAFFSIHCGHGNGSVSRCQSLTSATMLTDGNKTAICMNKESVRVMLNVVQYLRQQDRPKHGRKESTPWDKNFWLDLDYLQVAMAAQYCHAHFSTLMYAEIWFDVHRERTQSGGSQPQSQNSSQSLSQETRIDALSEASSVQSGVCVQDLLLEAYTWIGEPDGVYGCGAGRKADASSRICTYQHENQWDKAVMTCDIQMSQSAQCSQYDMLHVLQRFGTSHVLSTYLKGMLGEEVTTNLSSSVRELQFEAAWRVGQWALEMPARQGFSQGYHDMMYRALRSINEDHFTLADDLLKEARLSAIARLWDGCLDSTKGLYSIMADLQCAQIVQNVADVLSKNSNTPIVKLINDSVYTDSDFSFTDPVLHMQCSALGLMVEKSQNAALVGDYVASLRQLAVAARKAGRHQISERAIGRLKGLTISDPSLNIPIKLEESILYWARGEQDIAKHLIRSTIETLKKLRATDPTAARLYPEALGIYGNWLAETRSENPNIIMEQYMEKTISLLEELGEGGAGVSVDAYLSLARYADTQYQNIVNYMRSSTFEAKQSLMRESKAEAERLREVMGETAKERKAPRDVSRYLRTLEKQSEIDEHELESMNQDRNIFLLKAVENYVKCLRSGDEHNLRVFRLTSLWFNNVDNELVNQMIQGCIEGIKSYKWLPLMYQLAARMDVKARKDASTQFVNTLNKLIYDTCVTHPHHTLFCVLALANANRDTELLQQGKAKKGKLSKSQPEICMEEGRVSAAKALVERLRKDKRVGGVVKDMETLCDAYIQLANWNVAQYAKQTTAIPLPDALWIAKVKDLKNVPIPTKEIKVDPSGEYKDIPYILKFDAHFKLAGGINLPKIITCICSDGSSSRQLVKGRDDLRQDAVMQQVFGMVNSLLQKDAETRKRQLQIRKYKVIPLSQRSGLLEWCEGTQPIGEYLIGSATSGSQGAHARYRPLDWQPMDCRKHMTTASTPEGKLKAYLQICAKFQPVFRHFFLENFPDPPVWFQRRLGYTRSVATNSIVGYILGLGDRHPQNILIDKNTAELVHIDLGVAFEQGEILPTPETVPFRLTRDIEDAMGASGVEGVFRRCCEKTMEVMRHNQEALLTILEVLLYDPLHAWTISPAKAYELQRRRGDSSDTMDVADLTTMEYAEKSSEKTNSSTQESVNKLAERVLLRLQQKLQGLEDGVQLSLSGQVNHLIQEARNPHNLSRLFPGWQPFI